jgi:chaperone modulatory protein CbpM
MSGFDEVLRRCRIERVELETWIAREWVLPEGAEGGYRFTETDIARIEMICDLRRDIEIDDEAMSVVLPLLDQVYTLRASLKRIADAIATLPEPARTQLREALRNPAAKRQVGSD